MISTLELIVAFIILLVLFGPERLPEMAREAGNAVRELREAFYGKELKG
ncbi:MAG: twin-arginine translocase TatA/TatE family subunit [Candidatus Altiarchaeales archaeon]|nr:twin-arginine translocase TatA/TatE family subunit [Candidatus Altiarchaeales archaeon]MBD3417234.1 twin-arginine translocase TatA/TatE family subunit [Candidatus Altiarchaeales archaeon]